MLGQVQYDQLIFLFDQHDLTDAAFASDLDGSINDLEQAIKSSGIQLSDRAWITLKIQCVFVCMCMCVCSLMFNVSGTHTFKPCPGTGQKLCPVTG